MPRSLLRLRHPHRIRYSLTPPLDPQRNKNIQDAWLTFARTGDPSCEGIGKWPAYGDHRETMMLGEKCIVEQAPYDEERRAWDSVPNVVAGWL